MARATTKAELKTTASDKWNKMWQIIADIPGGAQAVIFDFRDDPKLKEAHWNRDKNMRDVLIHLYEWHRLLLDWTDANRKGVVKPFLPELYSWKSYGDMNIAFWKKHQTTTCGEAESMLRGSHEKVIALIDSFTNDELFEKKHFAWTGTASLGSYCISVAPSHYDWAMKKIKQHAKVTK